MLLADLLAPRRLHLLAESHRSRQPPSVPVPSKFKVTAVYHHCVIPLLGAATSTTSTTSTSSTTSTPSTTSTTTLRREILSKLAH